MIDSHCHLTAKEFAKDQQGVIERARKRGVSPMVTISDTVEESRKNVELAGQYADIFCMVGVHPHHAKDWRDADMQILIDLAVNENVVGIGEIGLDYHYDNSPRDTQKEVFKAQLELAKALQLPVTIHTRNAIEDTWKIVEAVQPQKIVLHCCCEQWSDVERFVKRGYFLSFTGIATYPKSGSIRETIKQCPLENMMVETDAPFLAPVPYRGKRNEPVFVMEVAQCIADSKGISFDEVDQVTTENAKRFFGI